MIGLERVAEAHLAASDPRQFHFLCDWIAQGKESVGNIRLCFLVAYRLPERTQRVAGELP